MKAVLPAPFLRSHLAAHLHRLPAFSGCTGSELRRLAQWGDLVEMHPGEVLVHEDHRDFWFFAVMRGQVTLSHRGSRLATLGPGSHLGEGAIVGLRPQPATATVTQPALLFVLGARYFLSLVATSPAFQRALFPDVELSSFREFTAQMLALGRAEWERVAERERRAAGTKSASPARVPKDMAALLSPERLPAQPLSLREAVARLGHLPEAASASATGPVRPVPRRVRWAIAATVSSVVVGGGVGLLFGYHPPRAVITAGVPYDVTADVQVSGATLPAHHGRLLLLWVRIARPNLAGYLLALARGDTVSGVDPAGSTPSAERAAQVVGREEYASSERSAVDSAAAALGVDPARVVVHFRDRGLSGPSAGLVYALAVAEELSGRDLTGGRVVAVTGAVRPDGTVQPVGWVTVKEAGAIGAGASILLVPAGQEVSVSGFDGRVVAVHSVAEALRDLEAASP